MTSEKDQGIISITQEFSIAGKKEVDPIQALASGLQGNTPDSIHYRTLQAESEKHKRISDREKAKFERHMEKYKSHHDRMTNYIILTIVSAIFLVSVATLAYISYNQSNDANLREKAISLLAPLTGLALGFLSGKIKWPAL